MDPKHFVMSRDYGYRSGTPEGDSESRHILETLFRSFSNHLVAVVLKVARPSGERPTGRNVSPGFLLVCRGRWFYLTAGHIFKRIEEAVTKGIIRVESAFFVDYFGPQARSRTILRFGFDDLPRYHVDAKELGLDVGVIELSPYYVRLFEANGIVPVTEKNWAADDLSRYQGFFVLGFPEELHGESFTYGSNPITEPTLIPLQRIPEPPSEITKGRRCSAPTSLNDFLSAWRARAAVPSLESRADLGLSSSTRLSQCSLLKLRRSVSQSDSQCR